MRYEYNEGMSDENEATEVATNDQNLSIRIPNELAEKAENAAKAVGLKKADVIRLAIDRGVDVLLAQLSSKPVTVEGEA